jgi:hypothetical protein
MSVAATTFHCRAAKSREITGIFVLPVDTSCAVFVHSGARLRALHVAGSIMVGGMMSDFAWSN